VTRVLVADDEPKLGKLVAEALEGAKHEVKRVASGREALLELSTSQWDLVVCDLKMPEVDGMQVLAAARAATPPVEVVLMTAYASAESAVAAMKAGAADYLIKPFSIDELRLRVARLAEQHRAARSNAQLLERLAPTMVARSPAMKALLAAARRAAATDASVLLLGESGTGKSQLARFIHFSSARSGGRLVELHCSALPESLLESELFGHVRGAFTGADRARAGHLEGADRGTLFLDEIGELPLSTQVKLLRFLQEREFSAVGSTETRKVDVRVVAATNRDLTAAVAAGDFREDFFYRLNVLGLTVPPLRERREDIAALIDSFLEGRGLPLDKVTPAARERLEKLPWPGNVRELFNTLERALLLAGEQPVGPSWIETAPAQRAGTADGLLVDGFNLDALEKDLVAAALARAGGNKTAAARLLGVTRRRLYSRLANLGSPDDESA
jgi:two-component system response regulator HydG